MPTPQEPDLDLLQQDQPEDVPPQIGDAYRGEEQDYINAKRGLELARLQQDLDLREQIGPKISCLAFLWLLFVWAAVFLTGFDDATGFKLDDTVLIVLASTATSPILALLAIVVTHVFPRRNDPEQPTKSS